MSSISVLIPTFNNESTIKECLRSIDKQSLKPTEIIVIDGHSIDKTVDIAKEFECKILFEQGGSRAAACNVGVPQAVGELIVFIDADAVAKENWLESIVKAFEAPHSTPVACVTGPNIEYPNESFLGKAVSAIYNTFIGGNWTEHIQSIFNESKRYVQSAAGCNAAYIRKHLEEVMPFNENLLTTEDTDINYRLLLKGYAIYFESNAIVYHQRPQTHKAYRKKAKKYAIGKVQFFRVHKTGLNLGHLLPPLYFTTGIFLILSIFANYWIGVGIAGYFGLYLLSVLIASIVQSIRYKEWKYLFILPIMFFEGHLWWSFGILQETFFPRKKSG